MKKILDVQNLTLLVFGIVLTVIAVFNSFMFMGLIEDGAYRFFEALTCKNFFLGQGATNISPYNLRYFPSIFSHFTVGFFVNYLGVLNIKYLLYLFTFVSYFKFIIFLIIIYLNLPKNKKDIFEIILLSFLITFTFTSYQVWAENMMTGLFVWVLFVIFYYVDFDKLSVFNKFCIVIFSFMLISSHQMVLVFIPFLLIIAIKKHMTTQNLKISSEILLRVSYIFLFVAIPFNIFGMFDIFFKTVAYAGQTQKYMDLSPLLGNNAFLMMFLVIITILILSFCKNDKKYDRLKYIVTATLALYILFLLLFKIPTENKFANITLGFHIRLFFFSLLLCIGFLKIKIEYKYIKIINLTLCLLIYMNSLYCGLFWKLYLTNINQYIIDNKKITLGFSEKQISVYPIVTASGEQENIFPGEYRTCHPKYILYLSIFMQGLFSKYDSDKYILIKTPKGYYCNDSKHSTTFLIIKGKDALKRFGIDIDSIVRVNKNSLLQ